VSRRKRKVFPHDNHERWLISYADFITLLFAFFVVMFASSQADKSKVKQISEAVKKALESGGVKGVVAGLMGADERDKRNAARKEAAAAVVRPQPTPAEGAGRPVELLPSLEYLNLVLKREIEKGEMQITLEPRGLVVSLRQAAFFPSGEDKIDPATYPSLEKVATAIGQLPNPVRLEGHTDAVPISTARFHSNWDLSAARAIAVLELLSHRFGIPQGRQAVAGYAETAPVAPNDTEEGRTRNRRVDIVILNQQQMIQEPASAGSGPAVPKQTPPKPQAKATSNPNASD
jgi:chemotaxis protein MotB